MIANESGPPTDSEALPTQVGPYRILRRIAEGGMGVVYEAEQTAPVKRRVALKLMQEGLNSRDVLARFEAERQALAVMEHPAIAKVYDAGAAEGMPYFVMEYVDGAPLTAYCDEHRLSTRERVELFIEVCEAVQHAHQKGVIHRDLKPSNVLVTAQGGRALPKVIDFGIAKAMGVKLTDKTLATAHDVIIGTPAYMSPEQAEGSGLDVDTRTDVYALGVMLYETLVGRLPVDPGELGLIPFIAQLIQRETNPPTPSHRLRAMNGDRARIAAARRTDGVRLVKELRGDLDWIVMKAMAPERERRYETVNALGLELERYLKDEPVRARPPSVGYRARKFVKRNTVGVIAGAVAVVALVAGLAAATVGLVRAERAARSATRTADFLGSVLEFGDPARMRGQTPTVRDLLDDARTRIETELADEPLLQARIYYLIGRAYYYLGRRATTDTLLSTATAFVEEHLGPYHLDIARNLTVRYYARGASLKDDSLIHRTVAVCTRVAPSARPGCQASAFVLLAQLRVARGELAEAERELTQAIATMEAYPDQLARRPELGDLMPVERLGHALNWLATIYGLMHRVEDEVAVSRKSVAVSERLLGPDHPELARPLSTLALALGTLGQYEEGELHARRAVGLWLKTEGGRGATVMRWAWTLAGILYRSGQVAEAESLATIVSESSRWDLVGPAMALRAEAALIRGRPTEAEQLARRALASATNGTRWDTVEMIGPFTVTLGETLLAQRRFREAEVAFAGAVGMFMPSDTLATANGRALTGLAQVFAATGRSVEAERLFERARIVHELSHSAVPVLVDRRAALAETLDSYGVFLRTQGRAADAARVAERRAQLPPLPGQHPLIAR